MNFYRVRLSVEKGSREIQYLIRQSICSLCPGLQIYPASMTIPNHPQDCLFQESFGRYVWAKVLFEPLTQATIAGIRDHEMPELEQGLIKSYACKPIIKAFVFFPSLAAGDYPVLEEFSKDWLFIEYGFMDAPVKKEPVPVDLIQTKMRIEKEFPSPRKAMIQPPDDRSPAARLGSLTWVELKDLLDLALCLKTV